MTSDKLKRLIKSRMTFYGYNTAYMAAKFHIQIPTWYQRMRHPERMTFEDIYRLDKMLHLGLINDL